MTTNTNTSTSKPTYSPRGDNTAYWKWWRSGGQAQKTREHHNIQTRVDSKGNIIKYSPRTGSFVTAGKVEQGTATQVDTIDYTDRFGQSPAPDYTSSNIFGKPVKGHDWGFVQKGMKRDLPLLRHLDPSVRKGYIQTRVSQVHTDKHLAEGKQSYQETIGDYDSVLSEVRSAPSESLFTLEEGGKTYTQSQLISKFEGERAKYQQDYTSWKTDTKATQSQLAEQHSKFEKGAELRRVEQAEIKAGVAGGKLGQERYSQVFKGMDKFINPAFTSPIKRVFESVGVAEGMGGGSKEAFSYYFSPLVQTGGDYAGLGSIYDSTVKGKDLLTSQVTSYVETAKQFKTIRDHAGFASSGIAGELAKTPGVNIAVSAVTGVGAGYALGATTGALTGAGYTSLASGVTTGAKVVGAGALGLTGAKVGAGALGAEDKGKYLFVEGGKLGLTLAGAGAGAYSGYKPGYEKGFAYGYSKAGWGFKTAVDAKTYWVSDDLGTLEARGTMGVYRGDKPYTKMYGQAGTKLTSVTPGKDTNVYSYDMKGQWGKEYTIDYTVGRVDSLGGSVEIVAPTSYLKSTTTKPWFGWDVGGKSGIHLREAGLTTAQAPDMALVKEGTSSFIKLGYDGSLMKITYPVQTTVKTSLTGGDHFTSKGVPYKLSTKFKQVSTAFQTKTPARIDLLMGGGTSVRTDTLATPRILTGGQGLTTAFGKAGVETFTSGLYSGGLTGLGTSAISLGAGASSLSHEAGTKLDTSTMSITSTRVSPFGRLDTPTITRLDTPTITRSRERSRVRTKVEPGVVSKVMPKLEMKLLTQPKLMARQTRMISHSSVIPPILAPPVMLGAGLKVGSGSMLHSSSISFKPTRKTRKKKVGLRQRADWLSVGMVEAGGRKAIHPGRAKKGAWLKEVSTMGAGWKFPAKRGRKML